MSYFVNVHKDTKKVRFDILKEIKEIKSILNSDKPCIVVSNDEHTVVNWAPEILGSAKTQGIPHIVRRILLDACEKGENVGAGSAELILTWAVELAEELIRSDVTNSSSEVDTKNVQNEAEAFLENAQLGTKLVSENELQNILGLLSNNPKIASMVFQSLKLAGLEGRIFVDSITSDDDTVELTNGYIFEYAPYSEVLDFNERWDNRLVKIAVIDGFVEKVSEINNILEASNVDVTPVILFSRGFAADVLSTLAINRARGTLNVVPVHIPFDEHSANALKDISITAGANIVSSLTGDLISSIKFDEMAVSSQVVIEKGKIMIQNEKSSVNVALLIRELQEKRSKTNHEAMQYLIDSRLRSLSSLAVRIKCSHELEHSIKTIDLLLRTTRAILASGVINLNRWDPPEIFKKPTQEIIKIAKASESTPILAALATIKHGTQAALELLSIDAALLLDRTI